MKLARTWSVALAGVSGHLVSVEAHIAPGLPGATVIGLGDAAVVQARDRVRAAVQNSRYKWPETRITLALSPAALPKRGAGYDLALAIALLAAAGDVPAADAARPILLGELALDGSVRPVHGVLPSLLTARAAGRTSAVVPADNLNEACLADGMDVLGARTLADLVHHLRGESSALERQLQRRPPDETPLPDMRDVIGQPEGRRALEIAAAGGHHLVMIGPPGAGKTMLATRLPSILPALDDDQALEVTAVHSVAGILDDHTPLVTRPPFVDPHHSASVAAVIGGGSGLIRPGNASMAHRGVLFLDEAPEFRPTVLDALRQPMESGVAVLARASGVVRYPARFQLVLAANPCPCAAALDINCTCAPGVRRRYLARLSGPLLDRVDIRVELPALGPADLAMAADETPESSEEILVRVVRARERAAARWSGTTHRTNAEVSGPEIRRWWRPSGRSAALVDRAAEQGRLTGRGYDRVLRVAATCADLAGRDTPELPDVATALALRCGEAA
ncbi:YifB family Mg chelatase-like AAA ATPase [Nakamurella sp. YIM 132087]|uniref:YifB family Mg chelatase-like AAA ATPase n=1 Tax=Nakamurella alba TaxID=2665158 RepID=A0A7K1FRC9_9ACTN|nr:YifB family Mg chelatase-like AAA ATPase [Nakamurella alba]MTD16686.1 YifB family Mg chelatase-like AAA ATPase [Nakamurella alba]